MVLGRTRVLIVVLSTVGKLLVIMMFPTIVSLLAIMDSGIRSKQNIRWLAVITHRLLVINPVSNTRTRSCDRRVVDSFFVDRTTALLSLAILLLSRGGLLALLLLRPLGFLGSLELSSLRAVVDRGRLKNGLLLLGLDNGDGIGEGLLGTSLALGVGAPHDLDLDTQDTLSEEYVAGGAVNEVESGLTGVDHEAVGELHGLGTSSTELTRDDNLATLGTRLHNEAEDTIAGTTDGETVEELVSERLALSDGGETAVLDLGGVERDRVLGELESLLDERGELTDAATLLTENLLGVGGSDDDIGDGGGDADFDTRVTLLGKLTLEELVELGVEDAVGDELPALRNLSSWDGGHLGRYEASR